jgi:hypothetical protein
LFSSIGYDSACKTTYSVENPLVTPTTDPIIKNLELL